MPLLDVKEISQIPALYFPKGVDDQKPYESPQEELEQMLCFLDMLCASMFFLRQKGGGGDYGQRGVLPRDEELLASLEPKTRGTSPCPEIFAQILVALSERSMRTAESETPTPFSILIQFLDPSPSEFIATLMALGPDVDRKYEQVFRLLQGDMDGPAKPTLGLVCDVVRLVLPLPPSEIAYLLHEDSGLHRFLLEPIPHLPTQSRLARPLSLKPRILSLLLDGTQPMGELLSYTHVYSPLEKLGPSLFHDEEMRLTLSTLTLALLDEQEKHILHLCGPQGVGKSFLLKQVSKSLGVEILVLDAEALLALPEERRSALLDDVVLKVALDRSILTLDNFPVQREYWPIGRQMVRQLTNFLSTLVISTTKTLPDSLGVDGTLLTIELDYPTMTEQGKLWKQALTQMELPPQDGIDIAKLTSRYVLNPAQIQDTLRIAQLRALTKGEEQIPLDEITQAIREQSKAVFGDNATRIQTPFAWDDLILSSESKKTLRKVCDRLLYRSTVQDDYGFGAKVPYGKGLSVLLYGPPGTGKTMTAQVLANELGLDIYRIDLSQVESKYIGESEKNLSAIFDAAKYSNAVLFFDEADSLFARRTEVSGANDRHANSQTAFLLQKVEEYSGVTVLATNNLQNFDKAFKRRFTFIVSLDMPDEETRLALWQGMFPPDVPMEAKLGFGVLAKKAKMSGSMIKSAALSAAYLAAVEGRPVTTSDLQECVVEEMKKNGQNMALHELM